jgi:thioredoxin reductase
MKSENIFDVIIIGGSYAGLSAAMALGRALRNVLVVDSGKPCNRFTPHSHNFLTQDGKVPSEIAGIARSQLMKYKTITIIEDLVRGANKTDEGFEISVESKNHYRARRLIFATGIKDNLPEIKGFAECWGKTLIHCPYCHGYEVRQKRTAIIGNGELGFEMARLISNWTSELTLFTNGKSLLTEEHNQRLHRNSISVIEDEISELDHENGQLQQIVFRNGDAASFQAAYFRPPFEQHCPAVKEVGCELTDTGYIKIDGFQQTTVPGIYACGDNSAMMRSIANAVYTGSFAGAAVNRDLIESDFK